MAERMGDLLVKRNFITQDQLKKAMDEQKFKGGRLESILVKLEFIKEDDLLSFLSAQYRVPSVKLSKIEINPNVIKLVPASKAKNNLMIPLQRDGYLVFLEDHNEALYRLGRMVPHHLLLAGVLEGVKGIVLGAFTGGDCETGRVQEVLGRALEPLGVPVLASLPVGHQPDNYTLPLGGLARLDAAAASLTLL